MAMLLNENVLPFDDGRRKRRVPVVPLSNEVAIYTRQAAGFSYVEWIEGRRVRRALEALQYSDMPVARIALAVGFRNNRSFVRAFRRRRGTTPQQYRRDHAKRAAS